MSPDSSLLYVALLFLEVHCFSRLFSFAQIFSRGDGTLGTDTASAVSGRKSQEGLDLLPLLTHRQAAENVPKDIFAILLTP